MAIDRTTLLARLEEAQVHFEDLVHATHEDASLPEMVRADIRMFLLRLHDMKQRIRQLPNATTTQETPS